MIWIFVIENIPKYKLFIKNEIKKWKLNWFKNTFDIITIKLISFLFEFLESKIYRIIRIKKNKKKNLRITRYPHPYISNAYILHNTIFSIVQYFRSKYPPISLHANLSRNTFNPAIPISFNFLFYSIFAFILVSWRQWFLPWLQN